MAYHALVAEKARSRKEEDERVGKEHAERAIHARASKLEGLPERVDELGRIAAEWLAPSLSEMEGFHGILALADRQSGKLRLPPPDGEGSACIEHFGLLKEESACTSQS
jgi:hypothetical protein